MMHGPRLSTITNVALHIVCVNIKNLKIIKPFTPTHTRARVPPRNVSYTLYVYTVIIVRCTIIECIRYTYYIYICSHINIAYRHPRDALVYLRQYDKVYRIKYDVTYGVNRWEFTEYNSRVAYHLTRKTLRKSMAQRVKVCVCVCTHVYASLCGLLQRYGA